MSRIKDPIIIANWRGQVLDLGQAKNILKDTEKEYTNLLKKKAKESKKKPTKKEISFYLSLPSTFIYPVGEFLKEVKNKNLKKISIGAQNFNEIEKTNKNDQVILSQLKSVGAKFVILNCDEGGALITSNDDVKNKNTKIDNKKINNVAPQKATANSILIARLNSVSQKPEEKVEIKDKISDQSINDLEFKKNQMRQMQNLEEKLKTSLESKFMTVLTVRDSEGDIDRLIAFIKAIIKNIHYNFFNNLIIAYESENGMKNIDRVEIDDCQEKTILIRRTIANMFGIDNAKKVRIVYSGNIDEINAVELLSNGGVDGLLLNEESVYPKLFGKILAEIA